MAFRTVLAAFLFMGMSQAFQSRNPMDEPLSSSEKALQGKGSPAKPLNPSFVLGPEDQIRIHVIDMEDIPDKPIRIDPEGNIDVPLIGTIHAAGLSVGQLRDKVVTELKHLVHDPMVTVSVLEFHSKPVTVLGAVNSPGTHQVEGPRTILETISMAGGIRPDAGSTLTITRSSEAGPIPIKDARKSLDGTYSTATMDVDRLMSMKDPADNIQILPNDSIFISTAQVIWVMGEVKKAGGFTLHSHETVSALQALAMAEGPQKTGAIKRAIISREQEPGKPRISFHADLKAIMDGKSADVPLQANDILNVPNNEARNATMRAVELAIQIGTGILIFRR